MPGPMAGSQLRRDEPCHKGAAKRCCLNYQALRAPMIVTFRLPQLAIWLTRNVAHEDLKNIRQERTPWTFSFRGCIVLMWSENLMKNLRILVLALG
eukprot:scaffold329165_cov56-Attheya_sp.AAC.1